MDGCKSNGCRRALCLALASHCKLVEADVINKAEEIIGYIQACVGKDYGAIFKQVATVAVLLNQCHPFGQFALSFNYQFFKALCNRNYERINKLVNYPVEKLYPEIYSNPNVKNEWEMMSSRVKDAIEQVCNGIYCDYKDPFCDLILPCTKLCKKSPSGTYQVEYDHRDGCIKYSIDGCACRTISIKEVAECIARCHEFPVNPITGRTMTASERHFLMDKLYLEISCVRYFLLNVEYKECGYSYPSSSPA